MILTSLIIPRSRNTKDTEDTEERISLTPCTQRSEYFVSLIKGFVSFVSTGLSTDRNAAPQQG